ncbi:LIM and senescent cell antigen-like-containing domain protein 2 [Carassius auratus]|uniref:LIM and senescent cell antigen-like-containing domain protein 1 n=1 Tax=Carassius auratus TaxID=7957 RepID=A0A6P6Q8U9_CARAU|nr:LIM and senescent cell antigen-like-containing domain protein 1 [Carassius auratus]
MHSALLLLGTQFNCESERRTQANLSKSAVMNLGHSQRMSKHQDSVTHDDRTRSILDSEALQPQLTHSRLIMEEDSPERSINGLQDTEIPKRSDVKVYKEFCDFYVRYNMTNALANAICERCKASFTPTEKIVNSNGELYHEQCFVCAQCFQQFLEGLFYEFEDRKYCEHDFQMLFAPCCRQCGEFIIGRVIKAMNSSWHPDCFCCDLCQAVLADIGFVKNTGRHLCRPCHEREKAHSLGKYICQKCQAIIDDIPLIFKNDPYHPDHFSCSNCGKELTSEARELRGELYCLPCHDKLGVPICGACRRPIEGRVVNAMGKQWHVEHFVCAKCEKPFLGHRHYERKGLAYCETHYNQLFGEVCFHCNRAIEGDVVSALNKAWCVKCFGCSTCNSKLTLKDRFVELDLKPVCKHCYERVPDELKRRLSKQDSKDTRKKKMPICL